MEIKIEELMREDLLNYKSLIDECFGGSNSLDIYGKGYDNYQAKYTILVAKNENNEIVGSLTFYKLDLFTFSFQPSLEIFNVCVSEKFRGQKIAKKLFQYTLDYAKENGYKSVHLTCLDTAIDAHRLYESIGMKRASSVKFFLNI